VEILHSYEKCAKELVDFESVIPGVWGGAGRQQCTLTEPVRIRRHQLLQGAELNVEDACLLVHMGRKFTTGVADPSGRIGLLHVSVEIHKV